MRDQQTSELAQDANAHSVQRMVRGHGQKPTVLDLFSGIGGFSLAFEAEGFETIGFAEIEEYATKVLKERWPNVPNYGDVRNVTAELNISPDVVTGGFPCQPFSLAGKRGGDADERYLWPECVRVMRELRPRFALFENVTGLLNVDGGRTYNRVLSDLAAVGYHALWNCVPACAVGAPIERDRIWIVAVSDESSRATRLGNLEHGTRPILPWPDTESEDVWIQTARAACGVDDGIPEGAYKGRVSCLGNSIVPYVARIFARGIHRALVTPNEKGQPPCAEKSKP